MSKMMAHQGDIAVAHSVSIISQYLQWDFYFPDLLEECEAKIFSYVKSPMKRFPVTIGENQIWTLAMNTESTNTPIVLLHGFGAAIGFWVMNLDEISANRPVYCVDLLGFGRSSRPAFSKDAAEIEQQFVESIEKFCEVLKIPKMILCGHSFGGFLAAAFALKHPERIEHLILSDPWGFSEQHDVNKKPLHKRTIWKFIVMFSPYTFLRLAGPYGEELIRLFFNDFLQKFESFLEDKTIFVKYLQQINNNKNATGEDAFFNLLNGGPWAKFPMGERLKSGLKPDIPLTFIYGATSWMSRHYGKIIKHARSSTSYTHVELIHAGHHVNSDNASEFNRLVNEACQVLRSQSS